jgi:hypothetical protein
VTRAENVVSSKLEMSSPTPRRLRVGVVLVAAASGLSTVARTIAEAVAAAAFIGMGCEVLRGPGHVRG